MEGRIWYHRIIGWYHSGIHDPSAATDPLADIHPLAATYATHWAPDHIWYHWIIEWLNDIIVEYGIQGPLAAIYNIYIYIYIFFVSLWGDNAELTGQRACSWCCWASSNHPHEGYKGWTVSWLRAHWRRHQVGRYPNGLTANQRQSSSHRETQPSVA